MGSTACAMHGPRSRAGLIAYPVGPPSERPIAITITPTSTGPKPFARSDPGTRLPGDSTASSASTSANPPMNSEAKFAAGCRIAGVVENTASLVTGSGVTFQCGRYASQTMTPPRNPPAICATMYIGTFAQSKAPIDASAIVTAGFRCAPLMRFTQYTAMVTPNAQPAVMTIQPELCPFVRCSTTLATTPSPSTIRIAVPKTSARMGDMLLRLLVESKHIPVRICKAGGFFGGIAAQRLHDETAVPSDGFDGRSDVVDHHIDEKPGVRRERTAGDPGTTHSTDTIVECRCSVSTLSGLPVEDRLIELD